MLISLMNSRRLDHVEIHKLRLMFCLRAIDLCDRCLNANKLYLRRFSGSEEHVSFVPEQQEAGVRIQSAPVAVRKREDRSAFQFSHEIADLVFSRKTINRADVVG